MKKEDEFIFIKNEILNFVQEHSGPRESKNFIDSMTLENYKFQSLTQSSEFKGVSFITFTFLDEKNATKSFSIKQKNNKFTLCKDGELFTFNFLK